MQVFHANKPVVSNMLFLLLAVAAAILLFVIRKMELMFSGVVLVLFLFGLRKEFYKIEAHEDQLVFFYRIAFLKKQQSYAYAEIRTVFETRTSKSAQAPPALRILKKKNGTELLRLQPGSFTPADCNTIHELVAAAR